MPTADDYTWINDTHLEQAACVAVVPRADRAAVLAAYGADEGSVLTRDEVAAAYDGYPHNVIQVVEVADALVVVEDNGFEGSRPEVVGPLSLASGSGVAAAFFWNVNALTTFTAARSGAVEFAVELLGPEDVDAEELEDVPAHLRALVVEGGSDEGDMLGAGLALVATHTGRSFTAADLDGGTYYETRPTPSEIRPHEGSSHHDPLDLLPGGSASVQALPPRVQRDLAEWATVAAARESGMADHPVVRQVIGTFGRGAPAPAPDGLDPLVRDTVREHDRFTHLAGDDDGWSDRGRRAPHPFYEVEVPGMFGPSRALSHLEGCYLAQRRWAVEAVRQAGSAYDLGAAVACLAQAAGTFSDGRTTRGWTFTENAEGRWRDGSTDDPRYLRFVAVLTELVATLASGRTDEEVWRRADAGLPAPLTDRERVEAIHQDASAAARGEFSTYQVAHVEGDGDDDGHRSVFFLATHDDADEGDGAVFAGLDLDFRAMEIAALEDELARLDVVVRVLTRPEEALAAIAGAPSWAAVVGTLASALGTDEDLASDLLAIRLRPVLDADLDEWTRERAEIATRLERARRQPPHH